MSPAQAQSRSQVAHGHRSAASAVGLAPELERSWAGLLPDPKRRSGAQGIDGWYPYYAGYSSDFAAAVLHSVPKDHFVLDTWNGSGTTTASAFRLGLRSAGVDLNPFADLVARAKTTTFSSADEIVRQTKRLLAAAKNVKVVLQPVDVLTKWLPKVVANTFLSIAKSITAADPIGFTLTPRSAFFLLVLIRAARVVAPPNAGSNPTWSRPHQGRRKGSKLKLETVFAELASSLGADAIREASSNEPRLYLADSRALPLEDNTVDLVLTSPPYCTRIDYAASTAFELACLRTVIPLPEPAVLRRSLMGTTMVRERVVPEIPPEWPASIRVLLGQVRHHKSYASSGYYYKNLWQYFSDATASLAEIARVLKPKGVALLVLQTSFYKDLLIDLPALYGDIGVENGLSSRVAVSRQLPSSRVMASLHPKAQQHRETRQYNESVLLLEKP